VLLLQLYDQLLDLEGQPVRLPVRPARAIRESFKSTVFVSGEDLVAGLTGDIELPAQHRHLLPIQQPSHEPQPFVHLATLLPRHFASPAKA
jgi:hypothetical protein